MNDIAVITQSLPHCPPCQAGVWTRLAVAAVFTLAVVALEAWLRVPIQPVLDGYLQETLSRIAAITAAVRKMSS